MANHLKVQIFHLCLYVGVLNYMNSIIKLCTNPVTLMLKLSRVIIPEEIIHSSAKCSQNCENYSENSLEKAFHIVIRSQSKAK